MQISSSGTLGSIADILQAQLMGLLTLLPSLLKAVVVLIIGILIAKLLRKLVRKGVELIGLDKLAAKLNEVDMLQQANIEIKVSKLLGNIVYYFVLLVFVMTAIEALGMQMISQLLVDFINYIPQALTALLVLLLGLFLADFIKKIVRTTCLSLGINAGNMIGTVIFYFIFLNIILIALRQAELQTEFMENNISVILAGVAGAFAIGYGLASKNVMANILASFYNGGRLMVGDEVTIEGRRGEVIALSTNAITLRSEESELVIPFSKLSEVGVEIHSRRGEENALPPHEKG
ncbi:hypothetical protein CEQ90_07025 [Lewinellaceae bacterium SD302]|nr:hypothetical protein CEQ90_07025 [Lewinellaceae bacterium SD302]